MKWLWITERATGLTALALLSLATFLGAVVSAHWRSRRFPEVAAVGLHRNMSLMSLVFVTIHALAVVLDSYVAVGPGALFVPFVADYRTFWVGLGTIAFDLFLAILITSMLRDRIQPSLWRFLHGLTYLCWAVATMHTLGAAYERQLTFFVAVAGVVVVVPATVLRFARPGVPRALAGEEVAQ
jgi:methionine sulfoxide reductase heme-binding subunit